MTGLEGVDRPREIAVVDIGSNSVRLVLYRLEGRAVWTVLNEKVLAGLGRDLAVTGRLSPEGVEVALTALRRFAAVLDGVRPEQTLVAATAAVRDAVDGPDFCARVTAETGLEVRVLTGEAEARYAALGVLSGEPGARGVVADMGGASLELVRLADGRDGRGRVDAGVTLPLGPFALTHPKGFDAARTARQADKRLKPVTEAYQAADLHAVGGAWRSLAQAQMARTDHPLRIVQQYALDADEARDLIRFILRRPREALEQTPGVTRRRADTLPHAAVVLERLIETLGVQRVIFSAWGLREGLLLEALGDELGAVDPLLAGCAALGARHGVAVDLPKALRDWLAPAAQALPAGFGARDPLLTLAACHLADIGARLHPDHRADLTFEQVLRAPVAGQTHAERAFLAGMINARYGGPAATPAPGIISRLLTPRLQRRARALGLLIRLACELSGRSPALLNSTGLVIDDGVLRLTAGPASAALLQGEQTRRRAVAVAESLDLRLALGSDTTP